MIAAGAAFMAMSVSMMMEPIGMSGPARMAMAACLGLAAAAETLLFLQLKEKPGTSLGKTVMNAIIWSIFAGIFILTSQNGWTSLHIANIILALAAGGPVTAIMAWRFLNRQKNTGPEALLGQEQTSQERREQNQ